MFDFFPIIKRLLPNGRAYTLFNGSKHRELIQAISEEPNRICTFYEEVQASGIPNGEMPSDALDDWDVFLALQQNSLLTDQQRNDRITGKYTAQGGQGPDYIEDALQMSGYPVYVVENIPTGDPSVKAYTSRLGGISLGESTLGAYSDRIDPRTVDGLLITGPPVYDTIRLYDAALGNMTLGSKSLGSYVGTLTEEVEQEIPAIPSRYIFIWFLTGPNGLNDFVDIPIEEKNDFISRVIQLKPAHTWVIAQVNFV